MRRRSKAVATAASDAAAELESIGARLDEFAAFGLDEEVHLDYVQLKRIWERAGAAARAGREFDASDIWVDGCRSAAGSAAASAGRESNASDHAIYMGGRVPPLALVVSPTRAGEQYGFGLRGRRCALVIGLSICQHIVNI